MRFQKQISVLLACLLLLGTFTLPVFAGEAPEQSDVVESMPAQSDISVAEPPESVTLSEESSEVDEIQPLPSEESITPEIEVTSDALTSEILSAVKSSVNISSADEIQVSAVPAPATGNVWSRIQQLRSLFHDGSYFSANGGACGHNLYSTCNNCSLSGTMTVKLGYSSTMGMPEGWTCVAFAKYAYYYVFGIPYNTTVYNGNVPSNSSKVSLSQARAGDIFVWNYAHMAMYLGNGQFFHSNVKGTNKVSYGTGYSGTPSYIIRANNYDSIDSSTAPTTIETIDGSSAAIYLGNILLPGWTLASHQYITSNDNRYILMMQGNGDLVMRNSAGVQWHSNTAGNPGATLRFQTDGNIVIYSAAGKAIWATNTNSAVNLVVQDDGNIVSYTNSGKVAWATNKYNMGGTPIWTTKKEDIGTGFYALISPASSNKYITNVGAKVYAREKSKADASQIMFFERRNNGTYKISSVADGRCLDDDAYGTKDGNTIHFYTSNGSTAQSWRIERVGSNVILGVQCASKMVFDAKVLLNTGTGAQISTRSGVSTQLFKIEKINPVTSLSFGKSSVTIETNKTIALKSILNVSPQNAYNPEPRYVSSNPAIASVGASGVVVGHKVGTVTITATSKDGLNKTATCKVTVLAAVSYPLTSFQLNTTNLSLTVGQTSTLKVSSYTPANTTSNKTAAWKSSNASVATVSSAGLVTAKAAGTATITCTVAGKTQTCKITVLSKAVSDVEAFVTRLYQTAMRRSP
ncbi:Ig-like domain-containing protein, partial [Ruminococcaceae bacterium OttesenSCG-928-A16]|nr:Ig-like domain-containing protein [Ruminococcaceae bacterium OttesenSCG-928-A16]